MAEKYGNVGNFNIYPGADYGFDPGFKGESGINFSPGYGVGASQFGVTTDPRTAAQLKAVSDKLSSGAKTIEVSGVSSAELESIPEHHLDEINRLRKLTGIDLTFHGPLVEPTGVTKQGWSESHREQAERQMWSAVERAHKLNPDGNVVITFHSSNGIPDPMVKIKDEKTGREEIKEFWVADDVSGRFEPLTPKPDYFKSKEGKYKTIDEQKKALNEAIDKQGKDVWFRQLQNVSFHAGAGESEVNQILSGLTRRGKEIGLDKDTLLKLYKDYVSGKGAETLQKIGKPWNQEMQSVVSGLVHGDNYLRDAYQELQTLFNQAYSTAKRNDSTQDLEKLDKFRADIKDKVKYIESPEKIGEFADTIVQGVNVLRSIEPPNSLRPLQEFAVDKASDTFSNLALKSYNMFKGSAPIISVENPPAGMGLTRAEDLNQLIDASRKKLREKLVAKGLHEREAELQAKKLIGVTWDVGHINMIRKFGYDAEDVVKETEIIAEKVKHVHLSDNFGLEHTELPMGMGNVPTKPMLEAIQKFNRKAKHIIETGGAWYRDFKISPLKETLRAFRSPVYPMQISQNWGNAANAGGGYFVGYGQMLPEHHFSTYGAGFGNMPPELGGQMSGVSRASGAPIE